MKLILSIYMKKYLKVLINSLSHLYFHELENFEVVGSICKSITVNLDQEDAIKYYNALIALSYFIIYYILQLSKISIKQVQ